MGLTALWLCIALQLRGGAHLLVAAGQAKAQAVINREAVAVKLEV